MLICWSADQPPGLADVTDSRNGLSAQRHHVALSGYPWLVEHVNRWRVTRPWRVRVGFLEGTLDALLRTERTMVSVSGRSRRDLSH